MLAVIERFLEAKHSHDGQSIYDLAKQGNIEAQAAIHAAAQGEKDVWVLIAAAFQAHALANGYSQTRIILELVGKQSDLWFQLDEERGVSIF